MNYIKLVNQFWQLRRSTRITNLQADLYFFLLQECNERAWQNPFQVDNIQVRAGISIAMSSLQDARVALVHHGLITFEPGQKNVTNPTYGIIERIAVNRHRNRYSAGNESGSEAVIDPEHKEINANSKQKPKPSAGAKAPAKKSGKKDPAETTEHWKKIVDVWFVFYESKYEIAPTFDGSSRQNLQRIIASIKKLSAAKNIPWTEDNAAKGMLHFFTKAHEDKWLRANYLLKNLNSQFDKIVTPKNDGKQVNNHGQTTGAGVNTESAFSKINNLSVAK